MRHLIFAFGIVAVSSSCGGCERDEPPPASAPLPEAPVLQEPEGRVPKARDHGPRLRKSTRPGARALIERAIDELELTDEQTTALRALSQGIDATEGVQQATEGLNRALAAGVRAGQIDDAALAPHIAAMKAVSARARQNAVTALNELHRTLTPEQRKALVEGTPRQGRGAVDWLQADLEGIEVRSRRGRQTSSSWLDLTRGLVLSAEQRKTLRELQRSTRSPESAERRRERITAMTQAFATDTFDAKAHAPNAEDSATDHAVSVRIATVRALVEMLAPEQRATLAAALESSDVRRRDRRR